MRNAYSGVYSCFLQQLQKERDDGNSDHDNTVAAMMFFLLRKSNATVSNNLTSGQLLYAYSVVIYPTQHTSSDDRMVS